MGGEARLDDEQVDVREERDADQADRDGPQVAEEPQELVPGQCASAAQRLSNEREHQHSGRHGADQSREDRSSQAIAGGGCDREDDEPDEPREDVEDGERREALQSLQDTHGNREDKRGGQGEQCQQDDRHRIDVEDV